MKDFDKILQCIKECNLSKLSKENYENEVHAEYRIRNNKLELNFQELISLLKNQDFTQKSEIESKTLCHLIILYLELQTTGPWNTEDVNVKEKSDMLNQIFINKYNINLCDVLCSNNLFESQTIFDMCIRELHKLLTVDNFKKHPSFIDVYCLLTKELKKYKVNINPVIVLPGALLLIDDYVNTNKFKGLVSCTAILQCLTSNNFIVGNYHEVVYSSLKKNIQVKDNEVSQALFDCFMEFLKIIPMDIKRIKLHDLFTNVLDQLYTESNLDRKVTCFKFATKIIELHGINCVRKKNFKTIILDNLDSCSNESVSELLLQHVLECLQMWISYCWCTWTLSEGHKILSSLFKLLYISKEVTIRLTIQNIIITLIKLCADEEQMDILQNLQEFPKCSNEAFINSLKIIKARITI